jgi:hypothetical protein
MSASIVMRRVLAYGGILAGGIAIIGGLIGFLAAGPSGLVSALVGTAMSFVFLGITAGSILLGNRASGNQLMSGAFFGIVLGGWLLKFVVFIALVVILRGQPWVQPIVLFVSIVVGVIGSLVVDLLVVARSRVPYVSDITLPTDADAGTSKP